MIPYQRYCFNFLLPIIMILIMKIVLHNIYKIINLRYPTYVYNFFNFPYNYNNRVLACFQTRAKSLYKHLYSIGKAYSKYFPQVLSLFPHKSPSFFSPYLQAGSFPCQTRSTAPFISEGVI